MKPLKKNMNMNKNDKINIDKIENLRARLVDAGKGRKGCILYIDGRALELQLVRYSDKSEVFYARLLRIEYNASAEKSDIYPITLADVVSDYLTTVEIYNVCKAGVNAYIERGF